MLSPTQRGLALGALALTAGSLLTAAPAHAEFATARDATHDANRFGDIERTRTAHRLRSVLVEVTFAADGHVADSTAAWIDTDPDRRGPEFVAFADAELGEDAVFAYVDRADGWYDHSDRVCRVRTLDVVDAARDTVTFSVPRRCLGRPERVRVSYRTSQAAGGRDDFAPHAKRYGPWLARA